MRALRVLAASAAAVGWLAGCAGLPGQAPAASEEERRAYASAVSRQVDDPKGSERALEAFLVSYPQSPLADDAGVRLAEMAIARDDAELAATRYRAVLRDHPDGDRVDEARVALARLEYARGNRAAADAELRRVRLSRLDEAQRRSAYRVMADVALDPVEKLRWLAQLRGVAADDDAVALVDVEIDELLLQLDEPDLLRAADQTGRQIPAARALVRAAGLALDRGDVDAADRLLSRASRLPMASAYEPRLVAAEDRLRLTEAGADVSDLPTFVEMAARGGPDTRAAVGTLGVVLPLSGRFAPFGEESLQGILLAAGVFSDAAGPRVRVLVRDSAGRPERAAQAVRELAAENVSAIVGPLLAGECEAAASAAEEVGVPLLALTAREEVSAARPHVFRVRTMPSEEVRELVDYAIANLGAQRFAILYPRDAYGRGLRRLFWEAVERKGGRVVGVAAYDPDATDFGEPIRRLVGYTLLTSEEKKVLAERDDLERRARRLPPEDAALLREEARALTGPDEEPLPPIVDFDALFIPESHDKVVLIAPQLAFHEAAGTTLLGTNGWYHPDLVRIAREHVDGARFTVDFYSESSLPFVEEFTAGFERAYAEAPDVFAAQAYDATNLVLVQLARGRDSREGVREGVLSVTGYPGVTGVLTMRPDGNARKRPFLLGVDNGRVTLVE